MQIKIILSVLALFSIVFVIPSDAFGELTVVQTESKVKVAQQNWYHDSWEFRKNITLSLNTATGVDSDLIDFPVLISFTDTDLIQTNESLGRDFVFTQSDGMTVLSHEIEKFDNTTGEVIAWVKLPTMSASSTTEMYIYYKGDTIGFNSADVWNDNYVLVWHLNQTSTGTSEEFKDSTSNGNNGRGGGGTDVGYNSVRIPHITDGQIGNGQHLKGPTTTGTGEGTGDIIYRNSLDGMPSRDFTIELWVADITNVPSGGNAALYNDLVSVCYDAGSTNGQWQNHISLWQSANVKMKIRTSFFVSTTNPGHPVQDDNPASFTNWNHIVAVYNQKDADGTQGNSQLYINGELVKDQNRSGGLNRDIQTDNLRMVLGGDIDAQGGNNCGRVNNELKGKVDELRISSGLRTADYAAATYYNQGDPDTYTTVDVEETRLEIEEEINKSDECYDCEAPKLAKVEVHIISNTYDEIINENAPQIFETRDYVWTFDQKTPYPMFDDYKTPIIADPGDKVEIILELTDNRTLERIADSGTYTNFLQKPNDMNTFYANNFDEYGKVSTTFYEWHQTGDDLFYDYDQTVEWSQADVVIEESGELDNRVCCNQDDLTGTFTISFNMKFLQPMQTTDVWVQGTDRSGNFFKVSLPLTLKVAGNEPLVFESKVNQKVLGFYDDSMLNEIVSDWTGSTQDVSELAILLGIPDEQLPPWVANLALWVSEDKLTIGDMIVSIEHLINN
ncbi:DUF2341 domain-containing protein [Nitrosopumilus sp.]|nr:DUF2341 domain-containing protein [Nitrosopumilus sp.]